MTATELIAELERLIAEHGDLEVWTEQDWEEGADYVSHRGASYDRYGPLREERFVIG